MVDVRAAVGSAAMGCLGIMVADMQTYPHSYHGIFALLSIPAR